MSIWNIVQQQQIGQNREAVRNAGRDSRDAVESVVRLRESMDRLTLVCHAMWSLLKENTKLSEDDLLAKVKEIDLMDGKLDGKLKKQVGIACNACQKANNRRHRQCIYCGADIAGDAAFDTL